MEAIFPVCDASGPQLKRNPLGRIPKMLASNIRLLLAASYGILLLWRTLAEGHIPEYWWIIIAVYFVSIQLTRTAETVWQWWQTRRVIRLYRSLDPSTQDAEFGRLWSASARHAIRELVDTEGRVEVDGAVERYPFARSVKVLARVGFWGSIIGGLLLYSVLILFSRRLSEPLAWGLWAIGTAALLASRILMRRLVYLESTLELTRFRIGEVLKDGSRCTVSWATPLYLRYRRWPRRLELVAPERKQIVRLDFDRIGIDRAVRLAVEYGGFGDLMRPKGDAA